MSNISLFTREYACLRQFLEALGANNFFAIGLKVFDSQTIKWSNEAYGSFWGFSQNKMADISIQQAIKRIPNFFNAEQVLANMQQQAKMAIKTNKQSVFQETLLSYKGFVHLHQFIVTPLGRLSSREKMTVELAIDMTSTVNLLSLLDSYLFYYPKRSEAASRLYTYLGLKHYFYTALSYEELRTMFAMLNDYRHKQIASYLDISPKTVANYLMSIRGKLKQNCALHTVLASLKRLPECYLR